MNILAIIGTPRKNSNTEILVDRLLEGAAAQGHTSAKVYLYDYDIAGCVDCRSCKRGSFVCTLKDGMEQLYGRIDEANVLVFGSPVYFYGAPGKMKLLVDRLRPYVANKKLRGKKAIVIAPSGEGPSACSSMIEMFRLSFKYLGMEYLGELMPRAYAKAAILKQPEALKQAYDLGVRLA